VEQFRVKRKIQPLQEQINSYKSRSTGTRANQPLQAPINRYKSKSTTTSANQPLQEPIKRYKSQTIGTRAMQSLLEHITHYILHPTEYEKVHIEKLLINCCQCIFSPTPEVLLMRREGG
jgi:hypothetical protein